MGKYTPPQTGSVKYSSDKNKLKETEMNYVFWIVVGMMILVLVVFILVAFFSKDLLNSLNLLIGVLGTLVGYFVGKVK